MAFKSLVHIQITIDYYNHFCNLVDVCVLVDCTLMPVKNTLVHSNIIINAKMLWYYLHS